MGKADAKMMKILEFVCGYIEDKGYPPSVREACIFLNIKSTATVHTYLNKLEELGYIKKAENKNRCIEVLVNPFKKEDLGTPLVGKVAAGQPITAIENVEDYYKLPKNLFRSDDLFILNVTGTSMINVGIFEGDKLIVHKQPYANNGEKVIALIDDSATVKTYYKENAHYRLQPENDTMEPIIVNEVTILGVVVGLIRKYK